MKCALMEKPGLIVYEDRPVPAVGGDEVLVRIEHIGICGSDVHYFQKGRIGDFVVERPIVLGHESAGCVVEVGASVRGLAAGDRVALEPGRACGVCSYCKSGRYNLCPSVVFMATPPYDGAFVEYVAYPAHLAFKLPEGVSTLEGSLIEPLAVGIHAANQGRARLGLSAAVLGAGCIGLVTVMALRSMGVTEIYATDTIRARRLKAEELGARRAFDPAVDNVPAAIADATGGEGVDIVLETAGSPAATGQTVELVRRGGVIVLVGMAPEGRMQLDFGKLIAKEASIKTVFRYRNIYPTAIRAVEGGLIPLAKIATDHFSFSEIPEAISHCINDKESVIKAVIDMP